MNNALHRWYDSLGEPWRLLLGLGLFVLGLLPIVYGDLGTKAAGVTFLVLLLLSRVAYLHGWF